MKKAAVFLIVFSMLMFSSCGKIGSAVVKVLKNRLSGTEAAEEESSSDDNIVITEPETEEEIVITSSEEKEETTAETEEEIEITETEEAPSMVRPVDEDADYADIYMSDAGTTLILRGDGACIYTEINNQNHMDLSEGKWSKTGSKLYVGVYTTEYYELYADVKTNDQFTLKCSNGRKWSDEVLYLTEYTEAEFIGDQLKDGFYISHDSYKRYDDGGLYTSWIEDNTLYFYGSLRYSETVSYDDMTDIPYVVFQIPMASDCKITAGGGMADPSEIEPEDFNRVFSGEEATGLGFSMKLKNGRVTELGISS